MFRFSPHLVHAFFDLIIFSTVSWILGTYLNQFLGELDPLGSHLRTQNIGIFRNLSPVELENSFSNQLNNKIIMCTTAADNTVRKHKKFEENRPGFESTFQDLSILTH